MKISPLRDPQDFQLETFERFRKVRELKGENIFPALLITSVEQLIIKKCFSFAFEVFFGVLFDVGENLGLQVNEETKLAISEFTVSMQSKRLAVFRELQKKQEFFEVVNGLGRIMMKENDLKTVENAQNVFAELNVDVFICESFWERNSRRTESVYVNLNVLRKGKLFYLMLETEDFMDQEAIEIEENQRIFELNEIERKKREKNQRKEEKRENRRRNEGILMRDEEVYRFQYLKKERTLAENEYFSMDSHEFAGRNFIINEMEDYRNFIMVLEKEAKIMIEFQKKEIKKQKNVQRCLNREEKIAKEFFSKNLKKCEKVKKMLEKEEKIGRRVCMYLTGFQERLSRDMQKEEKIVRTIEISTRDTCSASQKHLTFNEKAVKMFNREELRISTSSYESLEQEERFARKAEYYQKLESKAELEKKNAEDKYLSALKRIELQKIAEKHRQSKEKQLRMEREVRRKEEQKKYELDAEGQLSPRGSEESPEPPISEESLIHESKIIEAMVLICGSYFCNTCYRMLKRSSLFLKCSDCCSSAFKSSNIKTKSKSEEYTRHKIPAGSVCVGCNNIITRGEIVMCLCCYIRVEFLQDYTPTSCSSCMDAEKVDWVDTYVGSKFELIPCGFCSRLVNYCYVIEICTSCHDQICLHCLRKNHFLGTSVCNECHSRRSVNPYRKLPKSS
jgi:hypothetical protein